MLREGRWEELKVIGTLVIGEVQISNVQIQAYSANSHDKLASRGSCCAVHSTACKIHHLLRFVRIRFHEDHCFAFLPLSSTELQARGEAQRRLSRRILLGNIILPLDTGAHNSAFKMLLSTLARKDTFGGFQAPFWTACQLKVGTLWTQVL